MTCNQNCDQGRRCDCTEPKSDLAERLRELDAKVTPGEWMTWQDPISRCWRVDHKIPHNAIIVSIGVGKESDAALICALRNNLPAILAALEDAERYRWLRDEYTAAPFNERQALRGDDLTDAIDKARKEGA